MIQCNLACSSCGPIAWDDANKMAKTFSSETAPAGTALCGRSSRGRCTQGQELLLQVTGKETLTTAHTGRDTHSSLRGQCWGQRCWGSRAPLCSTAPSTSQPRQGCGVKLQPHKERVQVSASRKSHALAVPGSPFKWTFKFHFEVQSELALTQLH